MEVFVFLWHSPRTTRVLCGKYNWLCNLSTLDRNTISSRGFRFRTSQTFWSFDFFADLPVVSCLLWCRGHRVGPNVDSYCQMVDTGQNFPAQKNLNDINHHLEAYKRNPLHKHNQKKRYPWAYCNGKMDLLKMYSLIENGDFPLPCGRFQK